MEDIIINDRVTITGFEVPCEGVLYAILVHKKQSAKRNKRLMIRFNTAKNEMSGCSNGGYINIQEGKEIWDIIIEKLSNLQ